MGYANSQQSLPFSYRIGRSTVTDIINETCAAIWGALKDKYVRSQQTPEAWKAIAKDFQEIWNLTHCIFLYQHLQEDKTIIQFKKRTRKI